MTLAFSVSDELEQNDVWEKCRGHFCLEFLLMRSIRTEAPCQFGFFSKLYIIGLARQIRQIMQGRHISEINKDIIHHIKF